MPLLDLEAVPFWGILALFAAAAVAVWLAGTRLSRAVDAIAERRSLGKAFMGALLLGGITSLPEAGTTVSASAAGNADLAVNNLFGGVAMQVVLLALADFMVGRRALTSLVAQPIIFLQGMLLVLVLITPAAGILVGEVAVAGVGLWAAGTLLLAVLAFWIVHRYEDAELWQPIGVEEGVDSYRARRGESRLAKRAKRKREALRDHSTRALVGQLVLLAFVVLGAGIVLAVTGERIADETGLGSSFVGAIAVALATSLPEVSTTVSAVLLGEYRLAVSNIFGTNFINIGFIVLADLVYRGGPVLGEVGVFSIFGALLGVAVTAVYVAGLAIHRPRTVLRLGYDSLFAAVLYLGGVAVLYTLR